jgi:methionyl aminopeptidase
MSYLKQPSDLPNLERSCLILMSFLYLAQTNVKAGQDCGDWDDFTFDFFKFYEAKSSFLGHYGYKYNVCISIADEIVHGVAPHGKKIPNNCVVTFDCGAIYKGMYSDSAKTIVVGKVSDEILDLIETCQKALDAGISVCKSGMKVRDIAIAVDKVVSQTSYGNVIDLGGHGVGYEVWSEPYISHKPIQHYDQKKSMFTNKIICIEPMLTMGDFKVKEDETDEWTIRTADGSIAVHFEHELIITKDGCKVLTDIQVKDMLPLPNELKEKYLQLFS